MRRPFLEKVEAKYAKAEELIGVLMHDDDPTRHAAVVTNVIREAALEVYGKAKQDPPWVKKLKDVKIKLLKERAKAKREHSVQKAQDGEEDLDKWFQLKRATAKIRSFQRWRAEWWRHNVEESIRMAWSQRELASVGALSRIRAGTKMGPTKRCYLSIPAARPSSREFLEAMAKPGVEGGLTACRVRPSPMLDNAEVQKLLGTPVKEVTNIGRGKGYPGVDEILEAREDMKLIGNKLSSNKHRKFAPEWSWPTEVSSMVLSPRWLTKPGLSKAGVGHEEGAHYLFQGDPTVEAPDPSKRRLPEEFGCFTAGRRALTNLLAHVYRCRRLPQQACASYAAIIGKKGKSPTGDAVKDITTCLRMLHCFCHWWRLFLRVSLLDKGSAFSPPPRLGPWRDSWATKGGPHVADQARHMEGEGSGAGIHCQELWHEERLWDWASFPAGHGHTVKGRQQCSKQPAQTAS